MRRSEKEIVFGVLILVIALLLVSFAYAAFTQNLNINGSGTVKSSSWSIHFANLTSAQTTGTANLVTAATIKTGRTEIGNYSVRFYSPGDSLTYTFDVVNDGDYNAKISLFTKNTPTCTGSDATSNTNVCNNLEYTLKYTSNGENVKLNDTLNKGQTRNMTLKLTYKSTMSASELPSSDVTVGSLGITIVYAQDSLYIENSSPSVNPQPTSSINIVNRQNNNTLSVGDEVSIGTEHFYVVSTDSTNTTLLAKYNLLVGDVIDIDEDTGEYVLNKTLSSSDPGYGLQSSTAKGADDSNQYIGIVPFSGKKYWHDSSNDTMVLKYGTYSNAANYIYDPDYSTVAPSINYSDPIYFYANSNSYSIAYYIEEYVRTLGINGTGGLLTVTQANSLGCDSDEWTCENAYSWLNNGSSFWLGVAGTNYAVGRVWFILGDAFDASDFGFENDTFLGVRPVITVSTADIG